jgi:PAT family acetyl-CoA transporter-like MFS transporter 1
MFKVVSKQSVIDLAIILVTSSIPFIDGIVGVRFQEAGVPSETIALLATLTTPVHILLPWVISKFFGSKSAPLANYKKVYPIRIIFQLVSVALVLVTPSVISNTGPNQWLIVSGFYTVVVIASMISSGLMQVAFVSKMTFFAKVSDPIIGGTYMTVLNTISNIGGNVASQINYRLVDYANRPELGIDGFYVIVAFATVYGFVWIKYFGKKLDTLERLPKSQWKIVTPKRK